MVDFKLLLNPSSVIRRKSILIQQRCKQIVGNDRRRNETDDSDQLISVITGTYKTDESMRSKKLCLWIVFAIIIIIIIVITISVVVVEQKQIVPSKDEQEDLIPPNPKKTLPSSASVLRTFRKAAVCADAIVCAEIGRNVLKRNGSAVDAAVATMFCNGFVGMQSMGLGGGFLMTIYIRETGTAHALNAREKAPINSRVEMFNDDPLNSQNGPLSVAVPGELRGYWAAHRRFGKLSWSEIIRPSVDLCEKGYEMTKHQYDSLFKAKFHNDSNFQKWFYDSDGKFKKAGAKIVPSTYCRTLRLISENGGDDLYNGSLSEMFLEDLQEAGGIMTEEDLKNYEAQWMDPIAVKFRNKQNLYSMPPPGSGILLGFIMNLLDGYEFHREDLLGIENTTDTYHRIVEAFKYAYAKRTELGDTLFVNITELLNNLTSARYADGIRAQIDLERTSNLPEDYGAVFYSREDHGTAHVSVLAENGDAVSVTSSINLYFGAGFTSKRTGIIYNSVMDDFSFPYFKNYFGLPGSPNNELMPGKRPLSSMSPTILTDENGDVKLVIGASGGTKITTAVALVIMRTLWFEENIKEAVDAPRIHHQLYPMQVQYEYGTLQQVVDGLKKLGHKMKRYRDAGSIICALFNKSGTIYANADYRKGGDVFGID